MKLFVTGGAGFIGSNFILYWMKHHPEDRVVNYDALTYAGNLENLREIEHLPQYQFVKGDICDQATVLEAMRGTDVVVHFAAESHVDRSIMHPSAFVHTNVLGTQVLLDCAKEVGIRRFHHISTDEVFGTLELGSAEKFNEQTPYAPHSPYSASKAGSDHLVRAYADTYGLPISITNCSNNYGPYQFPEKLMGLAITNLLEGKKVPVYSPGSQVRDWLYVEDHVRAIELVLQKGAEGSTYCIGGMNQDISNLDVVKMIISIMGFKDEMIEIVGDRPGHDVRYAIDWSKIHTELGWSPSVTLEQGLKKTIDWFADHQEWWQSIKTGAYLDYYEVQYGERI